MPLRFLLDEQLRGPLWQAIVQHNAGGADVVDAVRVGDPPDLPLGSSDADILLWAEREGRILITRDVSTMLTHLVNHRQLGHRSPGIFAIRHNSSLSQVVFSLALYGHAGDPADVEDRIVFIP